jgi:PAS domain S-box-containing protein
MAYHLAFEGKRRTGGRRVWKPREEGPRLVMSKQGTKMTLGEVSPTPSGPEEDPALTHDETRQHANASEARYQSIVEGSLQGIIIQQDGRIVYANAAMARLFAYSSPSELIGLSPFEDLIDEEDLSEFRSRTAAVYNGEKVTPHPGWRARRRDRKDVWCGFRRSRPRIPIGSRPPIPIRSRPPFRFEAGHPAFASADRGDDVARRRIGQASADFRLAKAGKDVGLRRADWEAVGNGGRSAPSTAL